MAVDFIHAGKADTRKVILAVRPETELGMVPNANEEPSYDRLLQGMPRIRRGVSVSRWSAACVVAPGSMTCPVTRAWT
ncbi:MAG: hypothetical protein QM755_22610 [Luteolibacter sp.]